MESTVKEKKQTQVTPNYRINHYRKGKQQHFASAVLLISLCPKLISQYHENQNKASMSSNELFDLTV